MAAPRANNAVKALGNGRRAGGRWWTWAPWVSARTRIVWSAAAAAVVFSGIYFNAAARSVRTEFRYTAREMIAVVMDKAPGSLVVDSWRLDRVWVWAELGPFIAILLWCVCLPAWRRRSVRIIAAAAVWAGGAWCIAPYPDWVFKGVVRGGPLLWSGGRGSQIHAVGGAWFGAAWTWFMLPVMVAACLAPTPGRRRGGRCVACGYQVQGLERCPECGAVKGARGCAG